MANPFAQFGSRFSTGDVPVGDYRSQKNDSNDLVTLSYLTGWPEPRDISEPQFAALFRTLLKRDPRTRRRALSELSEMIQPDNLSDESVSDSVNLAYVQLYAKFSIDILPDIRRQAHEILGKLYTVLGKKSSKYLQYSVGPWYTGQFDSDPSVAAAARTALENVFPDAAKRALIPIKMQDALQQYIIGAIANQSARTLSDERYTEPADALTKYTHLVTVCLDTVESLKWPLDGDTLKDIFGGEVVWKFVASSDALLARTVMQMATKRIDELKNLGVIEVLGVHLSKALKRGVLAPVELLKTLTIYARTAPPEYWKETGTALAQYVSADPTRPARFWPLLYNLAVSYLPQTVQPGLLKAVGKVAPRAAGDAESEVWGCYIALAALWKSLPKVLTTVVARCRRPMSTGLVKSLARQIARVPVDILEPFLNDAPLGFMQVVAASQGFANQIGERILSYKARDIAELVALDPAIPLPPISNKDLSAVEANAWAQIAIHTNATNASRQSIVDTLVASGNTRAVLQHASALAALGIEGEFEPRWDVQEDLSAAVAAVNKLVSTPIAARALDLLCDQALAGDTNALSLISRALRTAPEFVRDGNINENLKEKLRMCAPEDERIAEALHTPVGSTDGLPSIEALDEVLAVPVEATLIYNIKLPIPSFTVNPDWDLVERALDAVETEPIKVALIASAARGWVYVTEDDELREMALILETEVEPVSDTELWELAGGHGWVAFHAAQLLQGLPPLSREPFRKPGPQAALIAQKGAGRGTPWFDSLQRGPSSVWFLRDPDECSDTDLATDDPVALASACSWHLGPVSRDVFAKAMKMSPFVQAAALPKAPEGAEDIVSEALLSLHLSDNEYSDDVASAYLAFARTHSKPEGSFTELFKTKSPLLQWVAFYWRGQADLSLPKINSPALWAAQIEEGVEVDVNAVMDWILARLPPSGQLPTSLSPPDEVAGWLLLRLAFDHGAGLRQWYRDLRDRQSRKRVDAALTITVQPALMAEFAARVDTSSGVTVVERLREVRAVREVDDSAVEIVVALPEQYPAKPAEIEFKNLGGVPEAKKRAWLLEAKQKAGDGDVLGAMRALLGRLDGFLDGVEPCAICYSVVAENKSLPNKQCGQCGNIYHTDCLYRWFHSNKNKLCPMCRSPI